MAAFVAKPSVAAVGAAAVSDATAVAPAVDVEAARDAGVGVVFVDGVSRPTCATVAVALTCVVRPSADGLLVAPYIGG